MATYRCGECARQRPLFAGDAGAALSAQFGVPLLARLPFVGAGDGPAAALDPLAATHLLDALG
jgi:hypothetical protein